MLTAHAGYSAKTHSASISGQLVAGGKPRFGVAVYVHQIGVDDPDTPADITDDNGSFSVIRPVTKTTSFRVHVDDRTSSCFDPSTAPAGCKSETLPAPPPAYITAIVPRKTDPRVSVRSADQALAKRSLLTLADFPDGQQLPGETGIPCAAFAPDLHALTVSGHASSPFFVTANNREAAYVTASVFTSVDTASLSSIRLTCNCAAPAITFSNCRNYNTATPPMSDSPLALPAGSVLGASHRRSCERRPSLHANLLCSAEFPAGEAGHGCPS